MKKLFIGALALISILLAAFFFFIYPRFMIVSGYAAKNMCSCVFVAGIAEGKAKSEDLNFDMLHLASTEIDYKAQTVTASVWGLNAKTAYYKEKTGCVLINKTKPEAIYQYKPTLPVIKHDSLENWFSYIDTVEHLSKAQLTNLDKILTSAFIEEDSNIHRKNTRATLVLYKGQLVGEQYAPGFDKNSRLMGWSMTKSLTATMLAMLANEGKIDLAEPTNISAWQTDERKNITWNQLLQMNSGLRWEENYSEVSDAVLMLFNSDGIGEYATQIPLEFKPDNHWEYSSGTSNILATAMHSYFNSTDEYIEYIYTNLFHKIGMYSMIIETDAKGRFVGSSYSWATARDWAKIGQLYLQNGSWVGEQLLTNEWVDFVQEEAPNSNGIYGGHFWLNKSGRYPDIPRDMYALEGFQGQRVFIIPSQKMVIVRLGLTYKSGDFDFNQWVKEIIDAIK